MINEYLKQIARIPLLTSEQEKEIGKRIRRGDEAAVSELAAANLRMVVSIAKRYNGRGIHLADLIQVGNTGLLTAARKFNPDRAKFSTLAFWWINQVLRRHVAEEAGTIHIPVYAVKLPKGQAARNTFSIDAPAGESKGLHRRLVREIPDDITPATFDFDDIERMHKALASLTQREQTVIRLRFGLADGPRLRLVQIARMIRVTRERVRQIENAALAKLKATLEGKPRPDPADAMKHQPNFKRKKLPK